MNKYLRAAVCVPFGMIKIAWTKLFHFKSFSASVISLISPYTEITMDRKSKLIIGRNFKMRDGSKIRVRKNAKCMIGKNTSLNCNNMIVCHDKIEIGDDVMFGPNIYIFDHDHDYRAEGGTKAGKYKTSPIKIGNNVWIGANTMVLRGTEIGDNCVIGAGSVVKGKIGANTVLYQKRENVLNEFSIEF